MSHQGNYYVAIMHMSLIQEYETKNENNNNGKFPLQNTRHTFYKRCTINEYTSQQRSTEGFPTLYINKTKSNVYIFQLQTKIFHLRSQKTIVSEIFPKFDSSNFQNHNGFEN